MTNTKAFKVSIETNGHVTMATESWFNTIMYSNFTILYKILTILTYITLLYSIYVSADNNGKQPVFESAKPFPETASR